MSKDQEGQQSQSLRKAEKPPKEVEPKVLTEDVRAVLARVVRPDQDDQGHSVTLIAERADTSPRTVYRVLAGTTQTLSLDLADRLCLAAGSHLMDCRLVMPNGDIVPYVH